MSGTKGKTGPILVAALCLMPVSASVLTGAPATGVGTAGTAIPRTGQTNSCARTDDGALRKGMAWPKPRFTVGANTNVVTDNLTGLMWTRHANLFGMLKWEAAVSKCSELDCGGYTDWRLPNVRELQSLVDYSRFRPALCNTAGTGQWVENDPFTGVRSGYYWSSTLYANSTDYAWGVGLDDGGVYHGRTGDSYYACYAWPVRGGR
jgi:hypothetical protein